MKNPASRILSVAVSGIVAVLSSANAFAGSFDSIYQGYPDLVFNVLEQKSATSFAFTICNQGDVGTGNGKINVVLQSNQGQIEERTYENANLASGACTNLTMYSVDGYTTASKRKTAITGTLRFEGDKEEMRTGNNKVTLPAKKARADVSDINYRATTATSTDPVNDLWGNSDGGVKWYATPQNNAYNNGYYNNTSYNNGYYSQPNPVWNTSGTQNVVYVYTGYNNGAWYNYAPNGYGSYTYTPYSNYTSDGTFYNNDYNHYVNFDASQPYGNAYYNYTNGYVPLYAQTYNTYGPVNYNSSCPQWVKSWDNYSQTFQWKCSNTYTAPEGTPDLYLAELRQNGTSYELTAKICNQGDAMNSSGQITSRVTNGTYQTSTTSYKQLYRGECYESAIPIGNLNIVKYGTYLLYVEINVNANVKESRSDNNNSYWRMQIQ
jgi:hypothetical protein